MLVVDMQAVGLGCLSATIAIPLEPWGLELYRPGTSAGVAMSGACLSSLQHADALSGAMCCLTCWLCTSSLHHTDKL